MFFWLTRSFSQNVSTVCLCLNLHFKRLKANLDLDFIPGQVLMPLSVLVLPPSISGGVADAAVLHRLSLLWLAVRNAVVLRLHWLTDGSDVASVQLAHRVRHDVALLLLLLLLIITVWLLL